MQVYMAVHAGGRVLVVRKKYTSQWRGGHAVPQWTVNQAGQWALPGGRREDVVPGAEEEIMATALREFREETGVDLPQQHDSFSILHQNARYAVVEYSVSGTVLDAIQAQVDLLVQPGAGGARPAGGSVVDWEFDTAQIANPVAVLGVAQPIPPAYVATVNLARAARAHTQAIDWYREIAQELRDL